MPIITKISIQKKQKDRYNLYLDDTYAFSVDEEVLIRFQLKKGRELTELDLTQIQYEDEIRRAMNQAIQYLSFRMRSEKEVMDHLHKKEWDKHIIEVVLKSLNERKYLNDLEFAKAYVRTQVNGGKKGPVVIKTELKQKGVNDSEIETALEEYPEDLQINHAIQLGNKLIEKNHALSEKQLRQKLQQYLLTKGYSHHIISIVMEEVQIEKPEDEEWAALAFQAEKFDRKYRHLADFQYKQKMKQALYRKGFALELIDQYLDSKEREDGGRTKKV